MEESIKKQLLMQGCVITESENSIMINCPRSANVDRRVIEKAANGKKVIME